MLVHICCAVDSHYFMEKLKEDYPDEELVAFFYDPNIHPYSEYYLRLLEVKRSCKMLGVELIEGEYDVDGWLNAVRGYEKEPEKGKRCSLCFDRRFEVSADKASELGHKSFTSTLLTSPKKSLEQLKKSGDEIGTKYGISFIAPDYRKTSGTQYQNMIAKRDALYRQDYCGCIYALNMQRESQNRLADELFCPISGQIQPESIEERVVLYEKRIELEKNGIDYKIVKERFLNWRLKYALLKAKGEILPSHIIPYSTMKGSYCRGKVEYIIDGIGYMNRNEIKFVNLHRYNSICKGSYKTVKELIFNPPPFDVEVEIRRALSPDEYSLSTMIVVDTIPGKKIEFTMDAKSYEDVKNTLIELK